jgi:hypothetical protein
MTWIHEIFRAFFVALGAMELFSNILHFVKEDGMNSARKQHQELPKTASQKQIKTKTIIMLIFGIIFLITGLYSYVINEIPSFLYSCVLFVFSVYAVIEAFYYAYWKTVGFAVIATLSYIICLIYVV